MANYVCEDFNALCTELGVQCTIAMNPRTFKMDFLLKNFSSKTVALFTDDWFLLVPAGKETLFTMPGTDTPWMAHWDE